MKTQKDNIIDIRNIRSLSGMNLLIPDYQRGYRWTRTQAKEMLDDFRDFISAGKNSNQTTDGFYCLQPIVVKPRTWKDSNDKVIEGYEVIDGQQRLTTLFLLLTAIFCKDDRNRNDAPDFKMFSISYQTRSDSKDFLENIGLNDSRSEKAYECIDFYHINQVFETFVSELNSDDKGGFDRSLVLLILGEEFVTPDEDDEDYECDEDDEVRKIDRARNVRVIWYEIGTDEKASAEDIFTRLNIGKIPLTNAELIKASFLKESNFGLVTAVKEKEQKAQQLGIALQQNKIAEEWNDIEHKLQREDFWYFLGASNFGKEYETRIEFVFDLMAEWNKECENYHTFNDFQNRIAKAGKKKAAENVWKTVKDYFRELEYWYSDHTLYHLIGFLIQCGDSIRDIMDLRFKILVDENGESFTVKLKKDEFIKVIEKKVEERMADIEDLDRISFGDKDKKDDKLHKVTKVLLLFNVLSAIESERSDIKFPFDKFKKESWDKEHIASQTDKDKQEVPNNNSDRVAWIDDMLYYFTGVRGKDAKDDSGKMIKDEGLKSEWVIAKVREYINSESKAVSQIKDEAKREQRQTELNLCIDLLKAKELSLLSVKQRSASGQKDEYDNLLKRLFRETRVYFEEDRIPDEDKDYIGNMALLNASINRSYGNAYFAIKRMHIRDKDSEGVFIPLTTKNVFMKYYSKRVDNMLVWTNDDAADYRSAIKEKLSRFLPKQDKK